MKRCVLFLITLLLLPTELHAQDTCAVSYDTPHTATLYCPFSGFANDLVYVYDRANDMTQSDDWRTSLDFDDDLWIFDAGADGTANLIIDFRTDENGAVIADLYDDQTGDGEVSYTVENGTPRITENSHPSVHVVAQTGVWSTDERINYNLDIIVDGQIRAQFGAIPENIWSAVESDGTPDYYIAVRDSNADGHPDYQFMQLLLGVPFSSAVLRFEMSGNPFLDEPAPIEGMLFWYYLGNLSTYVQDYNASPAPIQIDWAASRIVQIGEFVASRSSDHNWFIYSNHSVELGQLNLIDFENPFMFYDLANDADGYPELEIRQEYSDASLSRGYEYPVNTIRYSWDQDNNTSWDYKLELAGRHFIETEMDFPEFRLTTIPYGDLPAWVTERTWDSALFVAAEHPNYWTSEGIYEWSANRVLREQYLLGIGDSPPLQDYQTIEEGMRGEYNLNYNAEPSLYISPIDGRLHLTGAQAGLWNMGDGIALEYANEDSDAYIDRWTLTQSGIPQQTLIWADDYLIYHSEHSVIILNADADLRDAPFFSHPPRTPDERTILDEALAQYRLELPPDELRGLLDRMDGARWHAQEANLSNFRRIEGGFRFTLDLLSGFRLRSDLPFSGIEQVMSGRYIIQMRNGNFSILPYTSPLLQVSPPQFTSALLEQHFTRVDFAIKNAGSGDANNITARIFAEELATGEYHHIANSIIANVPGNNITTISAWWTPPRAGEWLIYIEVLDNTDAVTSSTSMALVNIAAIQQYDWLTFIAIDGQLSINEVLTPVLLLILAFASTIIFILIMRAIQQEERR